ncbi:MAG: T9SS type A sorting domain-containing protein [Ignavibacteriae bacterium]|nr:T9SS type A sorting domain-containing protein [Ignavibacteriota bacterium]
MKKYLVQLRGYRIFLSILLLIGILIVDAGNLWSQQPTRPRPPVLSLTASRNDYSRDWYPDGRIWQPVGEESLPREFLMPVFIENQWHHYTGPGSKALYVPKPIYSFDFKIIYDSLAVTPMGIVKHHPFPDSNDNRVRREDNDGDEYFYEPFASKFNITWDVFKAPYYQMNLDPNTSLQVRGRGHGIRIAGISTTPLGVTDTINEQFVVLFYVRFRINQFVNAFTKEVGYTPIYISSRYPDNDGNIKVDSINFNNWPINIDAPFKEYRNYPDYPYVALDYPDPGDANVLGGMDNSILPNWVSEGILPGMIYLRMFDNLPLFGYRLERGVGSSPAIVPLLNEYWVMQDPLTVDSGKVVRDANGNNVVNGSRTFELQNTVEMTRMNNIYLESDEPWLLIRIHSARGKYTPDKDSTKAYVKWLDEILGCSSPSDCWQDQMLINTAADPSVFVELKCDPDRIQDSPYGNYGGEKAGVYEGHITIASSDAQISPVRLKVTFINFRNPFEPPLYEENGLYTDQHSGITLDIKQHNPVDPRRTRIVFGTGHRATNGVDSLFGEKEATHTLGNYSSSSGLFEARWYLPDLTERQLYAPEGFGDFFPNDEIQQTGVIRTDLSLSTPSYDTIPNTGSRDIRDIHDTSESITYFCRYVNQYPITIEWDTQDFPEDAVLFLTDTLNGSLFPCVNMREATYLGGTRYSYYIDDPAISSFRIEYTLPKIIEYLDPYGNPIIKKGWNLLSLPVRPRNAKWYVFYPNAMNIPYYFAHVGGYQFKEDLTPGVGYFVKYSDKIDTKFRGVIMKRLTADRLDDSFVDKVIIYPGWNSIGGLSYPLNERNIDFDQHDEYPGEVPDKIFVRQYGIWGYDNETGYYNVSVMEPGLGYFMKSDKHGYLKLVSSSSKDIVDESNNKVDLLSRSVRINLRDNDRHEGTLYMTPDKEANISIYELPPVPPTDMFDVRYDNDMYVNRNDESVITVQAISYPLSINMDFADANYTFIDAVSNEVLGTINRGESGNVEVFRTKGNAIKVLRVDNFAGAAVCQPNPVASSSNIIYFAGENELVNVKLYDAIGNEVMTLVNNQVQSGKQTIGFNSVNLSNGKYICKINSGSRTEILSINVVR